MESASPLLTLSFTLLGLLVAAAFPVGIYWAHRRSGSSGAHARRSAAVAGVGTALWLGLTAVAAARGTLGFSGRPPTMLLLIASMLALALGIGVSSIGERLARELPLAALVGVQAFRLPLELIMHRAYEEGLMPVQMSYSGRNFDIVTGITAIVVAGLLLGGRMPLWGVRLWNWMGLALLVNIVTIANLSAPTPLRVFMNEPANTWVVHAPFVWLPSVMVLTALLGHIVIFRGIRIEAARRAAPAGVPEERTGAVRAHFTA